MNQIRVRYEDTTLDDSHTYVYHEGAPFTGEVVDTSSDGTVISVNTYVDGLEEGPQREWYNDGSRRAEYQARRGQAIGVALEWYDNGKLAKRQQFDESSELVDQEEWDEDDPSDR